MNKTTIEWSDYTWNPWIRCTKVSPGCKNCYAETLMDKRFKKVRWGKGEERISISDSSWKLPLRWDKQAQKENKIKKVFCASLSDVFDEEVETAKRINLFGLIEKTENLKWLLLTKRIDSAMKFLEIYSEKKNNAKEIFNKIMIGVSICTQKEADQKIPVLLEIKEKLNIPIFISMEPLLEKVNIYNKMTNKPCDYCGNFDGEVGRCYCRISQNAMIDWVIVGGESGANARPMNPEWARLIKNQCQNNDIPFFFKQWGEWGYSKSFYGDQFNISKHDFLPKYNENKMLFITNTKGKQIALMYKNETDNPEVFEKLGKEKTGNFLDEKQYLEFPECLK